VTSPDGPGRIRGTLARPWFWLMVLALVAADLATKAWTHGSLPEPPALRPVLGEWLALQKVYNPGGIFGLFQGWTLPLTVLRAAAVVLLVWLVRRQPPGPGWGMFTLGLLLAGALGNLYDNLSRWAPWPGNGEVRDFLRVDLGPPPDFWPASLWPFHPWPVFNLADACISVGFVLLLTGLARIHLHPSGGKAAGRGV